MATSNATLKCSWKTGIIYTVIIAVIAAAVIWVGLNNAMPYELTVYTADDDPISVLFTDDFYNSSMRLMMVRVIFPVAAYLLMYWRYTVLVGKYPYRKEEVKKGRLGKPWVLPLILQLALMLVWGVVSWTMISLGLGLDVTLFADAIMRRQFVAVYAIAMGLDTALLILGQLFFKPAEVQRA